jgi:hypothetical protein
MNKHDKIGEHESGGAAEITSLTRRQWLLRLGEAAVLAGFSGAADEAMLAFDSQTPASEGQAALPPGLYGPSPAHMAHALTSDQRFVTPPGSETEYVTPNQGQFEPAFFSQDDFQIVRQSVRVMLNAAGTSSTSAGIAPVTDETADEIAQWIDLVVHESSGVRQAARGLSAQHRTLAVHYYGGGEVRQLEDYDERKVWSEGLAWLKQEAAKLSTQGFLGLTEMQQAELLTSVGDFPSHKQTDSAGTRFYRALKHRTVEGYYTSRAGLKELDYQGNAFHAESPGCPAQ